MNDGKLINRTIHNPKEKLYFLIRYMKHKDIGSEYFLNRSDVKKIDVFSVVWIKRKTIIEVLKISPQVLNSWSKNSSIRYANYDDDIETGNFLYFWKKKYVKNKTFVHLYALLLFIYKQYRQSEKNKNIKDIKIKRLPEIYNNLDRWYFGK